MKRLNMLVMGVLCAVAMGCSNKDNRNSNKPGAQAATPEPTVARLSIDDDNEMIFTIAKGDTVELTLTGTARSDDMRRNALSNEDGSVKADVMTVSGKKHVFVAVKNREDNSLSSLYLFTSDNGTYNLRINNVAIARANALNLILEALESHVDAGMDLDAATNHMANAFSGSSSLTFAAYLDSLNAEVVRDPEPETPEEETETPVEIPDDIPDERELPPVNTGGEPTPKYLGPFITDQVTGQSRPRPRTPPTTRPPVDNREPGRSIVVQCHRSQSQLLVKRVKMDRGVERALPRMNGCVDRTFNDDDFTAVVQLGHALNYIDSINDINFKVEVDFSERYFVKKAYFKLKPVIWPNNGADWYPKWHERGGQNVIYRGANHAEFTREAWMDAPFRDSFNIQVTCTVTRSHYRCGH